MSEFKLGLLAQFETILPDDERLSPEEYLEGINKKSLLKVASFMLANNPTTSKLNNWKELIKMWFRQENSLFAEKVAKRCEYLEYTENQPVSFLFPIASLKFFEFAFSMEQTTLKQDEVKSELNLFKGYLIFLSESTKNELTSTNYLEQLDIELRPALTLLNIQYPACDFVNYELGDIFIAQIVKSYFLFKFLVNSESLKNLLSSLYSHFNIINSKEYFQFLLPVVITHLKEPDKWIDINVKKDENFKKNCNFLDALALKNFDPELNADFKLLRGNPIYKIEDGLYSIISPLFAVEKIYKGLYFKLSALNNECVTNQKIKDFRSFYTSNFSENYLLYNIMEHIYGKRSYPRFSGSDLSAKGIEGGPDYYIRCGNNLFLFENKDIFINAEFKQSGNFQIIEGEFFKKLYYENKNGKIKPKAIMQIVNNVEKSLTMANAFDIKYKSSDINIYPILILHDSSFNCIGLNFLVNHWFNLELTKLNSKGLNTSNVRKLTIINIDTLILYADFLRIKKLTLNQLVEAYIKFGVFNDKKGFFDFEQYKAAYGKTLLSFSHFIDEYTDAGFRQITHRLRDIVLKGITIPGDIQ